MNIKLKNDNYTIYEDFSVSVKCQKCGKIDHLKADHPQAVKINQIEDAGNYYLCLDCWKKQQDEKWEGIRGERREEILRGQAVNLANEAILTLYKEEIKKDAANIKNLLKKYYESYYRFLKEIYASQTN